MSTTARDTHFAGFATRVIEEMLQQGDVWIETTSDDWKEQWQAVIAQRAYDLVHHTIESMSHIDLDRLDTNEHVERIPDMEAFPEVRKQ